jgi:hypothetical protein
MIVIIGATAMTAVTMIMIVTTLIVTVVGFV